MLELIDVSYRVEDEQGVREIVKGVSLTVEDGFVALTGPNGGGKSTLAKLIAGIYQPTSGKILLDGLDITNMSVTERARAGISYAFQQPVRFKGITVKDYFVEMNVNPENPQDPERDRFVLSKGHTAPVLYATLAERGFFPKEDIKTLRKTASYLQGHPDMKGVPGVDRESPLILIY